MSNPEFSNQMEPNTIEQGRRFSSILENLDNVRQNFLLKELPDVELSNYEIQKLFQDYETRKAESIISELNLSGLGWFATPDTTDEISSDLEPSGDVFIDTEHKEILRSETTAADDDLSDQNSINKTYRINSVGELVLENVLIKEVIVQRGEPSLDDDVENIVNHYSSESRLDHKNPIREEVVERNEVIPSAIEAKKIIDDIARLVSEIIKLYSHQGLMINIDSDFSTPDKVIYKIESADDQE